VAAFHCSHYANVMFRLNKPFNPLLGETYECIRTDIGRGFKFVAEQVSHHPPASACHTSGNAGWAYATNLQVKTAFRGKDFEIYPQGMSHITFANGEHITFSRPVTAVHNIIVGKMWVDTYGEVTFNNVKTGDCCILNFKPHSFLTGSLAEVSGRVFDREWKLQYELSGKWTENLMLRPMAGQEGKVPEIIWTRNQPPRDSRQHFYFSEFATTLNELEPGHELILPPSDSRFRTDLVRKKVNNRNSKQQHSFPFICLAALV